MPRPCELKQINGAMWARLDMDWDGGPVTLYTQIELDEMKQQVINDVINVLHHWDTVTYGDCD